MVELTESTSRHNYWCFLWHACFLALASSFMDVDTVMPSMVAETGGGAFHIGLLVTIMIGGSSISQLFFASYLHNKRVKKRFLLLGINLRVLALAGLAGLFFSLKGFGNGRVWLILALVFLFSFSGAFANISYIDMMGKLVSKGKRKAMLSLKQVISSLGILVSAVAAYRILSIYEFPLNYGLLFLFASLFLLTASGGFWYLREVESAGEPIRRFMGFMRLIKKEVRKNRQLRNYLLLISTLGNALGLMAFLVLYAKENFPMYDLQVESMLILKIIGAVITSSTLLYFSKRFRYGILLYIAALLALSIPMLVIFSDSYSLLIFTFFIGGMLSAIYVISMGGILLEISTKKNRVIYAGAAGAGSIIPASFSMLSGWLIHTQGFNVFFMIFMSIILCSLVFIKKLECRK